jgi:hypothetical protein
MATSAGSLLTPTAWGLIAGRKPGVRHGLFFDPERVDEIRNHYLHHDAFADLRAEHAAFDHAAETAWMDNELRYNDQLFDMRRLGDSAVELAFVFLMTGDKRALALTRRIIGEIMKFERWDFFLDGDEPIAVQRASQATVAVSLVIDFLGNQIEESERKQWLQTMRVRGCEACFRTIEDIRHPRKVEGWRFDPESTFFEHRPGNRTDMNRRPEITFNTNLRAVPASALVIGALAYELEFWESEDTRRFREMGIWGIEDFREFFKSDGSYDEEVNYANYTALHILQAVIALRRHGGPDLTDIINWDAYVNFQLNMSMPTNQDPWAVVNWGDSGNPPGNPKAVKRTALPFWVARETRNGVAQEFALTHAGRNDMWSALWFDPSVAPKPLPEGPRLWVSELDRVVARTGFDKEHLVVAMRSGPPANHEQADRNSIIVKCFGEELVTDPLRPPYSYSDPAWKMRLTEGHSAVLIDGQGHDHHNGIEGTNASTAFARIVDHAVNDRFATWVSDATQAYRLVDTDIRLVRRSMAVLYGLPAVIIVDRITKWEQPSTVQSRFFGYNLDDRLELQAGDGTFTVRRPGVVMQAHAFSTSPAACRIGALDVPEELARQHPFVDVATGPTRDLTLVTVLSISREGTQPPPVDGRRDGSDFAISIGQERATVRDGVLTIS